MTGKVYCHLISDNNITPGRIFCKWREKKVILFSHTRQAYFYSELLNALKVGVVEKRGKKSKQKK